MTALKPVSNHKKLGPIYLDDVVQIYGIVPAAPKAPFSVEDAQKVIKKLIEAKKPLKVKLIAMSDSFEMKKKGATGKKPPFTKVLYADVKTFYQFVDSPGVLVIGIFGKGVAQQYIVLAPTTVERTVRLYNILQNGQWAPSNNLKNKVPEATVAVAPEPVVPSKSTRSRSSSSETSISSHSASTAGHARSASPSTARPGPTPVSRAPTSQTPASRPPTAQTPSGRTPSLQKPVQRSVSLSSTSSVSNASSSSSDLTPRMSRRESHQTISRYTPTRRSSSSRNTSPVISATPTLQTPRCPSAVSDAYLREPTPMIKAAASPARSVKTPRNETPSFVLQSETSTTDIQCVSYSKQVTSIRRERRPSRPCKCAKKEKHRQSRSESESYSNEEPYRVKSGSRNSLSTPKPKAANGGVFLITDCYSRKFNKQKVALLEPKQKLKSSKICYFRPESDSSSSDSSSDDEFVVRKINKAPIIPRSNSAASLSSSSDSEDQDNVHRMPKVYRVPTRN